MNISPLPVHEQRLEIVIRIPSFVSRRSVAYFQVNDVLFGIGFSHIGWLSKCWRAPIKPEASLRLEESMQVLPGYMCAAAQNGQGRSCQSGK